METLKPTPGKFAVNYGVVLGAIMIIISGAMYATDMALEGVQWPMYIYYLIFPTVIIIGISAFKKQNSGILSLGQAMKTGLAIAVISAIVYGFYIIIFNYLIDPAYNEKILQVTEDTLLSNPDIPKDIVVQQMDWARKLSNPILGSVFWIAISMFFGAIYSLISGLIMKNEE